MRHELDVCDHIRQLGTAIWVNDAVGRVSQAIERLYEPGVLLESTGVVRICLLHGTIRVVPRASAAVDGFVRLVLVGKGHTNADTDGDDCYESNESASELWE